MKRFVALLIAVVLMCSLCVSGVAANVVRTSQKLMVDGSYVNCEIYNIDGSNYFKLRDLAYILNGTGSQFAVGYNAATRTVTVETGADYVPNGSELVIGEDKSALAVPSTQTIWIDGAPNSGLSAYNIGGNNFFKLRDLGNAVGFEVDYDAATATMLVESREAAPKPAPVAGAVDCRRVTAEGITADVLTVDVKNPAVRVETSMVNNTVAARDSFANIVAQSGGAYAVITGNFMNGDSEGNYPIGHVMRNGELLYIGSGYSSFGITEAGEVHVGRPSIRVRVKPLDRSYNMWTAIGLNLKEHEQAAQGCVLYTPAFGDRFTVTGSGSVTVVSGGKVAEYRTAAPEDVVWIPADGYVLWLSDMYMRDWVYDFQSPRVGERVELEYFLYQPDEEGFTLDGVTQIFSGGPRLVKDGAAELYQEPQFSGDRFTPTYAASRTAVGVTADGKLVFISTDCATIPQLRAFMLSLGCVDAINLDGGASTGFYCNGVTYRTPGRLLATCVQIYVD